MSILDKLKRKKSPSSAVGGGGDKPKREAEIKDREEKKEDGPGMVAPETTDAEAYRIITEPIVTEKATYLNSLNKYVFKVYPKANKVMVKNAIEKLYKGIEVKDVRIINTKRKQRKLGRFEGFKPGYKKAIVTLKKGTIEVNPIQ